VDFVKVGRTSDLQERRGKLIHCEGKAIALWRVDGKVYAINNVCPHQHFSMLHQGTVEGLQLTCPMHGWTFSLEDGLPSVGSGKAKVYQVRVEGENVLIEKPESNW
jgi:nitrite reductase/ring-hydroxylating ferredoxin subunit